MRKSLDFLAVSRCANHDVAVIASDGVTMSYHELLARVNACRAALAWPSKALVLVKNPRQLTGLLGYVAALATGYAVILSESNDSEVEADLIDKYRPDLIIDPPTGAFTQMAEQMGYHLRGNAPIPVWCATEWSLVAPIHPELGLLARTSGSLGAAKTVRLSYENLRANGAAIATVLGLRRTDCTMTALPLDFSFGLSMLNSALLAGGAVALTTYPPSSSLFWEHVRNVGGTCVGAVPITLKLLRASRWDAREYPSLRLLLHAGGTLDAETLIYFRSCMTHRRGRFISMYGQTEATARIACLSARLSEKYSGSVGTALPGTRITVEAVTAIPARGGAIGEIVVEGPSVMMGYARDRADLNKGDIQGNVLRTGDLGYFRDDQLYVTGRLDRQVKIFGRRICLDEVEGQLAAKGVTVVVESVGDDQLVVLAEDTADIEEQCRVLTKRLQLPMSCVRLIKVGGIPYTSRGKIDRAALRSALSTATSVTKVKPGRFGH